MKMKIVKNAINAVTQADGIGVGFEMDIAGVEAQGFLEDLVHEG